MSREPKSGEKWVEVYGGNRTVTIKEFTSFGVKFTYDDVKNSPVSTMHINGFVSHFRKK